MADRRTGPAAPNNHNQGDDDKSGVDKQGVIWAWLENLYPNSRPEHGWLTINHSVRNGIATEWFPAGDWDDASDHAANLDTNVWFGVGLRRERLGPRQRGGNQDVTLLPGLWLDVDIATGEHANTADRPPTLDAAHALLAMFPLPPTAIVETGGGLHAWWHHPHPVPPDPGLLDRWASWWQTTAGDQGWIVDNVSDPARIMRLPATANHKHTPPRPVRLAEWHPDRRYPPGTLATHLELSGAVRLVPNDTSPQPAKPEVLDTGERPGDRYNRTADPGQLLTDTGWTLHHTDHAGARHYTRPGPPPKGQTGATVYPDGGTQIYTTNAEIPAGQYTPFALYTTIHHHGDYTAAARQLAAEAGRIERRHTIGPPAGTAGDGTAPPSTDEPGPGPNEEGDSLERPVVVINGRPLRDITTDITTALAAANRPQPTVFVRAGQLTRIRLDENARPIVETFAESSLRGRVARTVDTVRVNRDGDRSHVPPPLDTIRDLATLDTWPFPPLEAVTEIPTLRPDGTIHHAPGYDPATRLYHHPDPHLTVPAIPHHPDPDQITAARQLLVDELLGDFPFAGDADRANTLAALLTPLIRPTITGPTPLALLDAPEPGTGKSLLVTILATITTGRPAAMQNLPDNDEELRKTITATLLDGATVIVFDNIDTTIRSSALAQALTTDTWKDRLLGRNTTIEVPNRAAWFATGNNLQVAGDLARRCYHIRLDAKRARPYLRTGFRHPDLLAWTAEHRGELVAALLTLARAWWAKHKPQPETVPVLGGYQPWATTMAGILNEVGVEGFLANQATFTAGADVEADEWEAFLVAWHDRFDDRRMTTAELVAEIDCVGTVPMRDALPGALAGDVGRPGLSKKLGMALRRRVGRHYGDDGWHVIDCGRDRHKVQLWRAVDGDYQPLNLLTITDGAGTADEVPAPHESLTSTDERSAGTAGTSPPYPTQGFTFQEETVKRVETEGGRSLQSPRSPRAGEWVEEI